MSDVVSLVIGVVVILGVALAAVRIYNGAHRRWRVREQPCGKGIVVACRRGQQSIRIGTPVPIDHPEFSSLIEERRAEAYERATALNAGEIWRR